MIDRAHDLPLTKQAETLNMSRRSLYYVPELVRPADLALMRQMDELHLPSPARGCCATCWLPMGARWDGVMSQH